MKVCKNGKTAYLLTNAQRGVYFACMEDPKSTMYNIAFSYPLPKDVDEERYSKAVITVAQKHPSLFATIQNCDGELVMIPGEINVNIIKGEYESLEAAQKDFVKPFDLEAGPLHRFMICKTPGRTDFFLDVHHLVFDGNSLQLFFNQIDDAYFGRDIPDEPKTLFEVSESEETLEQTQKYIDSEEYFKNKLQENDCNCILLSDVGSTEDVEPGEGIIEIDCPDDFSNGVLEQFAKEVGVSESSLFMTAFAYTLATYAGTSDCIFTTASAGRYKKGLEETVGMFVKLLPVIFTFEDDADIQDTLRLFQKSFYETLTHDSIDFSEIANKYGIETDISFIYQSKLLSEAHLGDWTGKVTKMPLSDCQCSILFMVLKDDSSYRLGIHYQKRVFSNSLMRHFAETLFEVIRGFLTKSRFSEISLISSKGMDLYSKINATEKRYDIDETVNSLFETVLCKRKNHEALRFENKSYTYGEFDAITKKIANYIHGKGIGENDFVGVLGQRNDMTVLAVWGVIRSGAAVQPLDPTYPAERLSYMLHDGGVRLLIADRNEEVLSSYTGEVLYMDEIIKLAEAGDYQPSNNTQSAIAIIYTSGTTGTPKGCVLENRNLVAFFHNHKEVMELDENSVVASYASFGFDAGLMDIVTTILCGGILCIIPDAIRLDLQKLEEFYVDNHVTNGFMTTQVGRMFAEQTACETLKAFLVGGEKLVPFIPSKKFRFVNGYGPCETMAYICHYDVVDNNSIQPIGKPSNNTKLYVTDKRRRLLPPGAVGEFAIAGYQVGRGYLNLPDKTEEVFVANPFSNDDGYERMYLTGDMVRLLPGGYFEYVGRRDGQVKIRGFRVELTEVEEVIRRYPGITDATVAAFDEPSGGKYIAAYVVSRENISTEDLHAFIGSRKPSYMIPAVIMQIESIPYTQNQKVNKRALPVPKREARDIVMPENAVQQTIFDIAAEILGHSDFGVTTDLFEAGLTSIGLLKFNSLLSAAINKPISIFDVKNHSTIRELERFTSSKQEETAYEKCEVYSLMSNQMGVFIESEKAENSTNYNIPLLLKISSDIDVKRLQQSLCKAIDAHPYMKMILMAGSNGNVEIHRRDDDLPIVEIVETSTVPDDLVQPFKLLDNRLYRAAIYVTQNGNYLFLDVHHIIADGTSINILLHDMNESYAGREIEPESYSCYEASLDNINRVSEEATEAAGRYYDSLLSGCNTQCLPDKAATANPSAKGCEINYSLEKISEPINTFISDNSLTANAFFNTVFAYTLSAFVHAEDVTYCTVYNGRADSRLAGCFGMLVKTLPVRYCPDSKESIVSQIHKMQTQLLDTMSNDNIPFSDLAERYGLAGDLFFNYQGGDFAFENIADCPAEMIPLNADLKTPLSIEVFSKNGAYSAKVSYQTDYYCSEFTDSFMSMFEMVAQGFTKVDSVSDLELISASEKSHYEELNKTHKEFETIPAFNLIDDVAEKNPNHIAVKTKDKSLTFSELVERANILANALINLGIKADNVVGVILERSELVPVAEIGIMKAGGAFMNMLPSYPDDRIDFCMCDAGCKYVIATKDIIDARDDLFTNKPYKPLCIEELLKGEDSHNPDVKVLMNQLAYCIYTSGSTGTPKGVMLEHHNLTNFVQTAGLRMLEEKGSTILCMSSISFDMSLTEMIFSLCMGNTIYIAGEEEIHNPDMMLEAMLKHNVDMMMMTPSFAWSLLSISEFAPALSGLKAIALGAEAFQPILYSKLKELNSDMMIINGYGPTECTQVCSAKLLTSGDNLTIGSPFANTKFYVVNEFGHLLPRYAVGELVICGEGVCRGYVNLPEKNKETFIDIEGDRGYRSGDLVRINRDNETEFSGRADNQVKLRGFRIELDEIEAVMQEYEGIGRCKVVVQNNKSEDYLAAFYTAQSEINKNDLTAFLKKKLTYYMVPSAMMQLDKMPLTPSGKIDKKALPKAEPEKSDKPGRNPEGEIEKKIVELMKEVLNRDICYADDNFFEIGGTSLSAAKIVMILKSEGYKIEYQDIFDNQTAMDLAAYLKKQKADDKEEEITVEMDLQQEKEESFIPEILQYNSMEYAPEVTREPLRDVLLTGATGFLGAHILQALLMNEKGKIICLLRKGKHEDVITRLKATLVYYFEDDFSEYFDSRITVMEGDITDSNLIDTFKNITFNTLINCAASVKHYASDDSIRTVNVKGVENLIALCKEKGAKMIQISTSSVPGAHTAQTYKEHVRMHENELFVIDDMNNQYCQSKYEAELCMLNAIKGGMRGKIIRVGNLMGRYSDGEFQSNMHTNAFLNGLRGFVNIGKCPLSHATDPISFSPVDCTAKAVVLLAGTNDKFTAFHAESRSAFDEMKIVEAVNRCGITLTPVADEEYYNDFYRIMGDPKLNSRVSALLTNDRPDIHMVEADNRFTANILYRLGFSWPFIDDDYLEKVISSLDALDFFFMD